MEILENKLFLVQKQRKAFINIFLNLINIIIFLKSFLNTFVAVSIPLFSMFF